MLLSTTFFLLAVGHFLADFPLQNEFMAMGKSPQSGVYLGVPWYITLTAHATINGGVTYAALLAAGVSAPLALILGTVEIVAHWLTDWAKGFGLYGAKMDQAIHLFTKALYVLIIVSV